MGLVIIYIILSAFGIAGTKLWDECSALSRTILCVTLGWILFPCIIMFIFGKFIDNVNDRY